MAISPLLASGILQPVSLLSTITPLQESQQPQQASQQSIVPASSSSALLAADTYTPSQTTASSSSAAPATSDAQTAVSQPGPETTLNGQELAQNQVISAALDVRAALLQAGNYYISPTDQAWSTLTKSLASGDVTAAQTALAAYTQALPTDPGSLSPLTSPSAQFLSDLTSLGSALQSGDLTAARSTFQTAQYDKPETAGAVFSEAYATGNTSVEATMSLEAVEGTTAELTWLGYTPVNAKLEANIIQIAGYAGLTTGNSQSQSAQTNQLVTDLAQDVASGPQLTASQANDTSGNPFYKIVTSLLTLASPSELNKTLELLANTYGTGSSANASNGGQSASTTSVSAYA